MHKGIKEDQVDGETKVLEEQLMMAIRVDGQQEQGKSAVLTNFQHSSLPGRGATEVLV